MKVDRPWYCRYPHIATGFRMGFALGTSNYESDLWMSYLVCDYIDNTNIEQHHSRDSAVLCHKSYVLTIEKFLLRSKRDLPLLVNHQDKLVRVLAQWRLSEWI